MKNPCEVIKLDKYTNKIDSPTLLLMNRSFHVLGKIGRYDNWKITLVANGIDEINFDVHKYSDGKLCPVWDSLEDLKIVDVSGFGRFEISVGYTDSTETVKAVHGQSLEVELAQILLHDFHVNDEEAADMDITEYSKDNYDTEGNFIPTTLYREVLPTDTADEAEFKKKHSLLHRVLKDKAPHWSIGDVTTHISIDEESDPERSSSFQRTYTVDGDSIYDFLTGEVSEESNVVFLFDTVKREIHCHSLCDCIDKKTGQILADGIGEDTSILVSKNRLANEITISSNKDSLKNCLRIEGGDDIITSMVRVANMSGSNYIYSFARFQQMDMSKQLRDKIAAYQNMMSSDETEEEYYGEDGIYTRLCKAYDDLHYYESSMMPDTSKVTEPGSAKDQYDRLVSSLTEEGFHVSVSSTNSYDNNLFIGVTNNIQAYAQALLDSRFDINIIDDTTSYDDERKEWTGKIQIVQHTDKQNIFPSDEFAAPHITVKVDDDELGFAKQKIEKALSKGSMLEIDFETAGMDEEKMKEYFSQYSLNRLKSFLDGYDSCLSILMELGKATTSSDIKDQMYDKYKLRYDIVNGIKAIRQKEVDDTNEKIEKIKKEQLIFQFGDEVHEPHDFKTYIGDDLYLEFCKYRREDVYKNDNYISDGKSTAQCVELAKELIESATKEAKKSCVLQRTVSASLNNLFALPEFEPLYENFSLFNYIRIRTEDEILKLRIIGIEFSGESVESIQVTFSDQVESIDKKTSDMECIIKQVGNMSTTYPSTTLQAKKGDKANKKVSDIYHNGLNAAKTMLKNNDSNEVTITSSGIICRRMDDEGLYGDKQLRITGNIMAFTNDAWDSVCLAIGETAFRNPDSNEDVKAYGIIAENIVGKMMATESLFIGNESNTVKITGGGIEITGGKIVWGAGNVNPPNISDINGLKEFKDKVNAALTGSSSTEIGEDYVISPNIGGGYLYIRDRREHGNGISVEINPCGTEFPGHNSGYVFDISKPDPDGGEKRSLVMGVDINGDGYFNGRITSGSININNKFIVDPEGNVSLPSGTKLSWGDVTGTEGILTSSNYSTTITKDYISSLNVIAGSVAAENITGEKIEGKTIKGCTIEGTSIKSKNDSAVPPCSVEISDGMITSNNLNLKIEQFTSNDGTKVTHDPWISRVNSKGEETNTIILQKDCVEIEKKLLVENGSGISIDNYPNAGIVCYANGYFCNCLPEESNMYNCGSSKYLWKQIFAKSSEITTSDKTKKHGIKKIGSTYEDLFFKLNPVTFMFNDGDRVHMGIISQELKESMDILGLSDLELAAFCKDEKMRVEKNEDGEAIEVPDLDEDGNKKYSYGVRYSEFIMLNTHMIQKLYEIIEAQQSEIDSLKESISFLLENKRT